MMSATLLPLGKADIMPARSKAAIRMAWALMIESSTRLG